MLGASFAERPAKGVKDSTITRPGKSQRLERRVRKQMRVIEHGRGDPPTEWGTDNDEGIDLLPDLGLDEEPKRVLVE